MTNQASLNIDNYTVQSYNADFKSKLNLVSLFHYLQESAWRHASAHGFGFDDLLNQGSFWALMRLKVVINKFPVWGDDIRLETWSKQPDTFVAYRDFEVFDNNNKTIITAASSWVIVDLKSRRPQRIVDFQTNFPHLLTRYAIEEHPVKLPELSVDFKVDKPIQFVTTSDIDVNMHVNNANYIRWILDAFPFSFIKEHDVAELDINFMHETKVGEHYVVNIQPESELNYLCNIIRTNDNSEQVRVLIKFRKNK